MAQHDSSYAKAVGIDAASVDSITEGKQPDWHWATPPGWQGYVRSVEPGAFEQARKGARR